MPQRRTWGETLRRAAAMSPHEAAARLGYFLRQRQDGLRGALGLAPAAEPELAAPPFEPRFFFDPQDIPTIAGALQERLPEQAARILEQAGKIRRGRFDLLGYEDLDFGKKTDWHLDPVSGKRAPRLRWHRVPYLDYASVGDHKVIWELNRHQHLVTLAKAWWLGRDDRYLATLVEQWYDWRAENPYGVGINWASSLEVAFRALSWLWVLHLLPSSENVPAQFRGDLVAELGRAALHIERYLSTYFAPNTHLLGEAVALFFVGMLCPRFHSAQRWRELGWRIVVEQAEKQVRSDGLHFEQSTYYHVYALDFFLHARLLAARNRRPGAPPELPLDKTIERMAIALQVLGQGGAVPRFGDDDGGRLFDPSRNRSEHLSDPLATCAVLFGRADFKAACPQLPEETLWLLGVDRTREFDALTAADPRPRAQLFDASGLAVVAAAGPPPHVLTIDAGPQGFGNAGHGHADALSVQLIVEGHHALTDPGTYCYPVEKEERNLFRGTAAHSTLEIDGLDQAEPRGPFAWRNLPHVRLERWVEGRGGGLLIASHDGYQRLSAPVTHRRWVVWLGGGVYVIRDLAAGAGSHRLRLGWRLGPQFQFGGRETSVDPASPEPGRASGEARPPDVIATAPGGIRCAGPDGIVLDFLPVAQAGLQSHIATAPWSPAYGRKLNAPVLYFEQQAALPSEFAVAIAVSRDALSARQFNGLGDEARSSVRAYQYRDENRRVTMLFHDGEGAWSWRGWSSDAVLLVFEAGAAERYARRVFLAGGSFLESSGLRVLGCRNRVQCWEWLRGTDEDLLFCSEPEAVEHAATDTLRDVPPPNSEPA